MSEKYIKRSDLDDTIGRLNNEGWQITRGEYKLIDGVLFEMPTYSIEDIRPKGEWIDDSPVAWRCSCCDYQVHRWNNTNFCPNCGADMRR